ncbi:hypothetical protein DOP62_14330 (plasmid) [Synechococcus elongatus PCC 11801]|uniref:Uncharacterized protein n=1 Tax=Synechococcus elongatus PCC 11801 TaxID=2219813 RepID=A0ACD5A3C6_SYNEL
MSPTVLPTPSAPLTLGELQKRYGLKTPNALRSRVEGLGIQPQQDGRSRVVAITDVALLDELHEHLGSGGTISSFLRSKGMAIATVEDSADSDADAVSDSVSDLATVPSSEPVSFESLLNAIAAVAQSKQSSPGERYRFLDDAAQAGWQVTKADLRWATGQSTVKVGQWRDYIFERVGRGLFRVHRADSGKGSKPKKGKG